MDRNASADALLEALPYSKEAEQSVLGAVIADPARITDVLEYLKPESFYGSYNREIFSVLMRMFLASEKIDVVTLLDKVLSEGIFPTESDAKMYLVSLVEMVPSTSNVADYARIVQEKYYLRSLAETSRKILDTIREGTGDAKSIMDRAEQDIFDIRKGRETGGLTRIDEVIIETYDRLQKLSGDNKSEYVGTPSGFGALDTILTGLNKSDLILVAARPGMGKTSFALNIATNVAVRSGKKVAVFSLEMSKEQLVGRILSSEALIQSGALRTGNLTPEDWTKLAMTAQMLSKAEIYIDDTPSITVADIKAKIRRIPDIGLGVIDYLQLMTSGRRSGDNRVLEISEITRGLKIMAKELNVPVITLSQLSRGPDSRQDHRPMLSDLRESGSIEQDADIVLFLYRDAYYNRESEEQNVAECIVAKNRHGETDSVKLGWDGQFTRFKGLELFRNEG